MDSFEMEFETFEAQENVSGTRNGTRYASHRAPSCPPKRRPLKTRYIMDEPPRPPFPWGFSLFVSFLLILTGFGMWLVYEKKQQKSILLHKVAKGETIRDIALRYYGDSGEWQRIFLANREKLKNGKLKEGDRIIVPIVKKKEK